MVSLNNDFGHLISKSDSKPAAVKTQGDIDAQDDINMNQSMTKNYSVLKHILEPIITHKEISIEELERFVEKVEKQDLFLKKDPLNLVLLDRDDFTNFTVFFESYKSRADIIEKILTFDPSLPKLIVTDSYQPGRQETITRFLLRYVYLLVYYIETNQKEEIKTTQAVENSYSTELSIKESNDQRVVSSPQKGARDNSTGSSFTEISGKSSNEEEKIVERTISDEKVGEEKRKPHSESGDDWQIEENKISI